MMKHSTPLPVTSSGSDQSSLSSSSTTTCNNTLSRGRSILAVASLIAIFGAATTIGYNRYYASDTITSSRPFPSSGKLIVPTDVRRARQLKEHIDMRQSPNRQPNGLQRFGDDDSVMPDTSSSVMSEDPVIPNYGFDGISDSDVHKILHGDGEKEEIVMNEDESKDAVTVDQQQTARRRNAIAAKQGVFNLRDKVVISFLNSIDVEAGDWIGIVPEKVGSSGLNDDGMVDGDAYITYRYVCDPDADPLYCPHTGSVEWDVQSIGAYFPPGKYVAYLCKEDGGDDPGPYVVKAGPAYFEISAIIEAPPTNPPPTNRPPTNPNRVEIIEPVEIVEAPPTNPPPTNPPPTNPPPTNPPPTNPPPTNPPPTNPPPTNPPPTNPPPTIPPPTNPPPTSSPFGSLKTLMNGGIRNNGIMFEIETKQAIRLTSIDIHTPLREKIPVTVYTATGGLTGKEQDSSKWNKISSTTVMGNGDHQYTPIVLPIPLVIFAGTKLAFYIDTPSNFIPGPLRYSPAPSDTPTGSIFSEDDSVRIIVGTGNDPYFGTSYPNRIFNGQIHYARYQPISF